MIRYTYFDKKDFMQMENFEVQRPHNCKVGIPRLNIRLRFKIKKFKCQVNILPINTKDKKQLK